MERINYDLFKFQRMSINNSLFSKLVLNLFHRANRSTEFKYVDSMPCIQLYADYGNADTWILIRNYICYLAEEFPSYIKVEAYQSYFKLFYFDESFFDSSTDDAIYTWARQKSTPIYTFVKNCLDKFEDYYQHRERYHLSLEGFPARKVKINECYETQDSFSISQILSNEKSYENQVNSVVDYLRKHSLKGQSELKVDVTGYEESEFLGNLFCDIFTNLFCENIICQSRNGLSDYQGISSVIQLKYNRCMKAPLGIITLSSLKDRNRLYHIEYSIKYLL